MPEWHCIIILAFAVAGAALLVRHDCGTNNPAAFAGNPIAPFKAQHGRRTRAAGPPKPMALLANVRALPCSHKRQANACACAHNDLCAALAVVFSETETTFFSNAVRS